MAIIVEDGSIVAGANSYVTTAELADYAGLRGLDLPVDVTTQEQLLILATDYLLSREDRFKGRRVSSAQALAYPRNNVILYGYQYPNDEIPSQLKNAQMEAAIQANEGSLLINNTSQGDIQREKVDVIEREYFRGGSWSTVRLDRVNAYLAPLLLAGGQVQAVRI